MRTAAFDYSYHYGALTDIGKKRNSNQDEVILCPEFNFFAVSDGMGGLRYGGETADYVKKAMPVLLEACFSEDLWRAGADFASEKLLDSVKLLSDQLFQCRIIHGQRLYLSVLSFFFYPMIFRLYCVMPC